MHTHPNYRTRANMTRRRKRALLRLAAIGLHMLARRRRRRGARVREGAVNCVAVACMWGIISYYHRG